MTLDQLAAMVAHGFEDVRREIREVRTVVDGHTVTLEGHTAILGRHAVTVEGHTAILNRHTAILEDHTHRLDRIERKLDNVVERVGDHDVRIQALEKHRGSRS